MSKHTPGPWTVADEDIDDGLAIEAAGRDGGYVPVAWVPVDYDDRLEREANAALIARAPEMAAEIERLYAENEKLRAALNLYREAVRIDVTMEGPKFMGLNGSALKRAWDADRATLEGKQ